uniref:GTP-binding nuclear protein n=1 Tax=Arcella intermedia TaxID=1963864 RepID=A0A6B2LHE7_9EUKA
MKCIVIGDGSVGKTSFIRKFSSYKEPKYISTAKWDVQQCSYLVDGDKVVLFNMWDTCGREKFGGLRDGYYIGSEVVIIMADVTNRTSFKNIPSWYRDVVRVCGEGVVIVVVGNKIDDLENHKKLSISFMQKKKIPYIPMSVHCNYNIELPFQYIFHSLFGEYKSFEHYCKPEGITPPLKQVPLDDYESRTLYTRIIDEEEDTVQKVIRSYYYCDLVV